MARVKTARTTRARHKKVLKQAKGYYGAKHYRFRMAKQAVLKSGMYAYVGRKDKKSDFRKLWIVRINAAARMNGLTYSRLISGLKKANVTINRKMLAEIAVTDPKAFTEIAEIAKKVYGADGVDFLPKADKEIEKFERIGFGNVPICMAKNQYSLTDDAAKLGRPTGFRVTVRDITISAGAGFLVALTGSILKMPGLPKVPAAVNIDVDENGVITGLF
jgi:ribosomal protein L20